MGHRDNRNSARGALTEALGFKKLWLGYGRLVLCRAGLFDRFKLYASFARRWLVLFLLGSLVLAQSALGFSFFVYFFATQISFATFFEQRFVLVARSGP